MHELYNDILEVNEIKNEFISLYIEKTKETFSLQFQDIPENEPYFLTALELKNQILFKNKIDEKNAIFIYAFENKLFFLKERTEEHTKAMLSAFPVQIENQCNKVKLERTTFSGFEIIDENGTSVATIENFFTEKTIDFSISYELEAEETEEAVRFVAKAEFDRYYLTVYYDMNKQEIKIKKTLFEKILENSNLSVSLNGQNKLSIKNKINGKEALLSYKRVSNKDPKKVFGKESAKDFLNGSLLGIYTIDKEKYYIYLRLKGVYIIKKRPGKATRFKVYLKPLWFKKNLYLYGRMVHHAFNSFGKYEELYTIDEKHPLATFKRPFRKVKFLKQFGYFKIPMDKMDTGERVHYPLFIGAKDFILHKFPLGRKPIPSKNYSIKRIEDKVHVVRTNIYKQATYSIVPYSKMYSLSHRFKIEMAYLFSKLFYKNKKYNVNLYFEKQASKADESGFRVFQKVKEVKNVDSKNYFILDETSPLYPDLKKQYGKSLIKRFSFKHYLSIFNADYFIGSDLSNHVINDRIYNNKILDKVKKVPLVFLQHGIMFAKPVENPLGKIFYKDYSAYNVYKNVVNSKLEAKEFYKMGYEDDDLIYSGLSTFDYAKLDKTSDKIVYMPTYRYWEEGMIYSGEIEKTTYFKSLIKVIKAFEKAGLRDKLMIVSHNKFADYIKKSMTEYQDVLGENPSEALKVARIFITDFSSAIYDGIYRGTYPIFYWEDKEYLTLKYQAAPPVNEENAPGPIAWNAEKLVEIAKHAIEQNYEVEEEYKQKYKAINSFDDNKNTERIIEFLQRDQIL